MRKHYGMALLLVLAVLGFLVCVVLIFAQQLLPEARAARIHQYRQASKVSAEQAAKRALAELQARLGEDRAASFIGEKGKLSTGSAMGGSGGDFDGGCLLDDVRWSWGVTDLSLDYDQAAAHGAVRFASLWAKSPAGFQKLPVGPLQGALTEPASRALEVGSRAFFETNVELARPLGPGWGHFGLLTNSLSGGFRRDLSMKSEAGSEFGVELSDQLDAAMMSRRPAEGVGIFRARSAGRELSNLPVLADLRLSIGIFNSRSDGRHRVRFHATGLWWNPSALPLLADSLHRLFLVEVVGAPEITVRNLDSGADFTVNLDECPLLDLGVLQQTERERSLWFWADIPDRQRHGMLARGLLPGEVFGFVAPSSQPQGLARILTSQTWRYDDEQHGVNWRRPSRQTFCPEDRIQIEVRFPSKTTIHLHPAGPEPDRHQPVSAYPLGPIASLRDISFPDFRVVTTGADYSREDSKGYVISERRACLRLRLRHRSGNEIMDAVRRRQLPKYDWNFGEPADAAEWVVDNPLLAALDADDYPISRPLGFFWDSVPAAHLANQPGSFASYRVREIPLKPFVSLGFLRHMLGPKASSWKELLDGAFLSAPLSSPEAGVFSHHPRLWPALRAGISSADSGQGAGSLVIAGAFNVNSRSADAWFDLLSGGAGKWSPEPGGPFPVKELKGSCFYTQPSGASSPQWGVEQEMNLDDVTLKGFDPERIRSTALSQSVRAPEGRELRKLAEKIVELQPSCGWPFSSLGAFAESPLLDKAIAEAGLNSFIPSGFESAALFLKGDDLLEAFAPMLTVRGDTFRVVGRAEVTGVEVGGGWCEVELVVQRVPAPHGVPFLGRRFRIISGRIRN